MLLLSTKLKNRLDNRYTVALKNIIINGNKRGCSGFVALEGNHVYVNTENTFHSGYLYRTAEHGKDYTGGVNCYACTLEQLVNGINKLLKSN